MHAKADNPELLKAQELGLKIYSYPNFIRTIQKNKTRCYYGPHFKSSSPRLILIQHRRHDELSAFCS
jgi:UDP-N-acetylmuramate: L-alanyl-gamma-D-glutamyl-meso-diaminopimelate ligase